MPTTENSRLDLDQLRRDTARQVEEARAQRATSDDSPARRVSSAHAGGGDPPDRDDAAQSEGALWQQLEAEHGTAVGYAHNGEINGLRENFWAARYRHGQPVIFDEGRKAFFAYEEGVYREVSEDWIRKGLAKLVLRVGRLLDLNGLEKFRNARSLCGVVTTLRGQVVEREPFSRDDQRFIVLANGVLLLHEEREPDLVPHSPQYRSTHAVPIAYEPQARCPRFENELLAPMLPQAADRRVVQLYFGMCLFGRNLAQRLLLLRGEGNDGKSQLVNVLTGLIGRDSTLQLRSEHLGQRFEMGMIGSKSLLVGVDVSEDFLGAERSEVIKALVGGDHLMAEIKGSMREERVKGDKCLVVTSNGKLRVKLRGDKVAWRRRLIYLECASPPDSRERIAEFGQALLAQEGPGILNWALRGLRELLEEGGQIDLNEEQQERVDGLLGESDALAIYLRESLESARCENTTGRTSLTIDEIWNGYVAFCTLRDWGMSSKRTLAKSLTDLIPRLFSGRRSHNVSDQQPSGRRVRGYQGVRWRDGQPPEGYQDADSSLSSLDS